MSPSTSAARSPAGVDGPRAGRPPRVPQDATPWDSPDVDHRARTGWLLLASRAVAGVPRGELCKALGQLGVLADPSRMSRWESGRQQPPVEVVQGYEQLLGLEDGRLLAPVRVLQRLGDGPPGGVPDPGLDDLLTRALDPASPVPGGEWMRLASALTWHEHVFLREDDWAALAGRVVSELARSVGVGHHRRHEACLTLLDHRSTQRHLLRAVGAWVTTPDVQVVTPVVGLLADVGGGPDDLVVRLLRGTDARVAEATVPVAAAKLHADQLAPEHLDVLVELVAARLTGLPAGRALADLLDLACALPDAGFERVVQAQRDGVVRDRLLQIRSSATLLPDAAHRRVARSLGWRAQWGTEDREPPEPDPMLERLVREALFHVQGRRRELAGRLLAASPYGAVLATHVAALTEDRRDLLATRAWELLLALGHGDAHRTVLEQATDPRAAHRPDAMLALGLGTEPLGPAVADALVRIASEHPLLRYHATLALGLGSPGSLGRLAGLDPATDRAVAWWRSAGSLVVDTDASDVRVRSAPPM